MAKIFELLFPLWPQLLATLIVILLVISNGLAFGWTSPYLMQLTSKDAPFHITDEEGSWIASLLPLGRMLGAIIGSVTLEYFGSKTSVLLSGLPILSSWICITCATSPIWLYVGRILSGMSMGMTFAIYPFYMGEITSPSIRGALMNLINMGLAIGICFGNLMGPNMSMMYFGIISLILTLCFMGIFPFFPETPYYYVQRNDTKRAEQVIRWYNRKSDVTNEMESVEHFVKSTHAMSMKERLEQLREPKNRQSFIIIIITYIFLQGSGLNTIVFYMEVIVRKAMFTLIEPSTLVIIINASGIITGFISTFVIDHCGRRIVLAISSFGVMMGMILLGLHFLLLDYHYDPNDLEWLLILSLLMIMLNNFGVTPIPATLMGELFPPELKSVAGLVGSIMNAIYAFVFSKTYQPLIDLIGETYLYWLYAMIFLISLIYSLTVLPETRGKTLQEIQDMMAARNITKKSQQEMRVETKNNRT